MQQVKLMPLEIHNNGKRGSISVIENAPFPIKRVFCIYNVSPTEVRGGHAHKKCHQILVALCGAVLVKIVGNRDFVLDCPDTGLYIPPKNLIHLHFLEESAVLMVLASEKYDPDDYLYGDG